MRCERCRKLLSWYLESDLPSGEMREIEEHLSTCKECSGELKLLEETLALARELPQLEPPEETCLQLLEKVRAIAKFEKVIYIWREMQSGGKAEVFFSKRLLPVDREVGRNFQYQARIVRRLDGTWWKFARISFLG